MKGGVDDQAIFEALAKLLALNLGRSGTPDTPLLTLDDHDGGASDSA